jgi:AcrR family transcriptional regulator
VPGSRRQPLTRARVLDAALALVDEVGVDGLSMRRLGEALGVEAMSLYNHVPSKAALLDGLHERILAEVAPPLTTGDWQAFARHQARSLHAALCAHPGAISLFASRPAATEASLARLDTYLTVLQRAGFAPIDAQMIVQIVSAFVVGHALWTAGTAEQLPPSGSDPELELGLDALLTGLELRLTRRKRR